MYVAPTLSCLRLGRLLTTIRLLVTWAFPLQKTRQVSNSPVLNLVAHFLVFQTQGDVCISVPNCVVIHQEEADLDHRVTQLGWRLVPSIPNPTDVPTPWYACSFPNLASVSSQVFLTVLRNI
jgi:hypothetical protein